MDPSQEFLEARDALLAVINQIDNVEESLSKARSWGVWDMIGGGLFSSLLKRSHIREANDKLDDLEDLLVTAQKELLNINLGMVSNSNYDFCVDIVFDNIFTDLRVQSEIKAIQAQLVELRKQVADILDHLGVFNE